MSRAPIHPGEILTDELEELGISASELARLIDVPANWITQIIAGKRAISADSAVRLGHFFGTSAEFWLNLQKTYELDSVRPALLELVERLPDRNSLHPVGT